MIWNAFLRVAVLLGLLLALVYGQSEGETTLLPTTASENPASPPESQSEGGLTDDQRAALWAGFVGGMVCIFGMGMLFYDMVVRKYANQYRYTYNVDMHVETYKP